ncbi:MAG TPA: sugar phosphate isomerase/epimerase family protein [Lachnospiraceae bacterium]|nr:sugar phosphate isomerase/epimerase family protein [Lachnospiraceae bacterium]
MLEQSMLSGFADEIDSSFDIQLRVLKELGQKYIELRGAEGIGVVDFTDELAKELKEKMSAAGVKVSAIGSPIGKIGVLDDFAPHFEKYKRIVELAHYFDTSYIRMFSFYLPDEQQPEKYRDEVFDRLVQMISYARKENVVLLHENEKGIYGAMAAQCKDMFEHLYGDNFQGIFDFANFIQCKQETVAAFELLRPYISYFHVKDAMWESGEVVLPGTGDGKLSEILNMVDQDHFSGFLSLEPHLFQFKGFDQLEMGDSTKVEGNGIMAYKAASHYLKKILGD